MKNVEDLKFDSFAKLWQTWMTKFQSGMFGGPPIATIQLTPIVNTFILNSLQTFKLSDVPDTMFITGRIYEWNRIKEELGVDIPAIGTFEIGQSLQADYQVHQALIPAIETLMSQQIVAGWTLFETLFGDLWEAVLNAHPHGLSDLKGKRQWKNKNKNKEAEEDESEQATAAKVRSQVQLNLLQKYGYDLRERMGTVLKDKFTFTVLKGVIEAYDAAFWRDSEQIDAAMRDPSLRAISAVRNLIVHRAGICDSEYYKHSKGLAQLPPLQINEKLELDGQIVSDLLLPAFGACIALIRAVDDWMVAH